MQLEYLAFSIGETRLGGIGAAVVELYHPRANLSKRNPDKVQGFICWLWDIFVLGTQACPKLP